MQIEWSEKCTYDALFLEFPAFPQNSFLFSQSTHNKPQDKHFQHQKMSEHGVTFIVETVTIDEVTSLDKIRYNTNNNYKDGERPVDYQAVVEDTSTSKWIDQFKEYKTIHIDLTKPTCEWMLQANAMGIHTGKFPKAFEDERDMLASQITQLHPDVFNGTEYFIRTESVSLKCGQHKAGPYTSMTSILESLVTCKVNHTPVVDNTKELTLYFIPWVKLSKHREYRGFVCNSVLTAISQQHLYDVYEGPDPLKDAQIIYNYFMQTMRTKITFLANYSFDIAFLDSSDSGESTESGDEPYFIEMNCFGENYAAGSALFGWVQDHDILYGEHENKLYFRYTVR